MATNQSLYASFSDVELVNAGNYSCPGCMAALAMRHVLKAMGEKTIIALTTSCWSVIDGMWPYSSVKVPLLHGAFGTAASMGRGIRAALDSQGRTDVQILAWGGDGGTYDIGMTSLSAAAAHNEDMVYVCYDNEAYMNTGGQQSTATPPGMLSTNTSSYHLNTTPKKDIVEIMAAHQIPLAASASVGYPQDLLKKIELAKTLRGFKFIHVHTPCPTGWQHPPEDAVRIARLAVQARIQPLYHVLHGRYVLDLDPEPILAKDYFHAQARRTMKLKDEEVAWIQHEVDRRWQVLQTRCNTENQ